MLDTLVKIETKYTLCDTRSSAPLPPLSAEPLVQQFCRQPRRFGAEFLANTIQVHSASHNTVDACMSEIREGRDMLLEAGNKHGYSILGMGIHPLMKWREQRAFSTAHNQHISTMTPYNGLRYVGNGLHVHVSSETFRANPDLLIHVANSLRYFVPHLIALSASSPFWQGYETSGVYSYRASNLLVAEEPFGGLMNNFEDAEAEKRAMDLFKSAVPGLKINSDISIDSEGGSLEFIVMDMVPKLVDVSALASLCQSLVVAAAYYLEKGTMPDSRMMLNRWNRWNAGLTGTSQGAPFFSWKEERMSWPELRDEMLQFLAPAVQHLQEEGMADHLNTMQSPAAQMVAWFDSYLADETPSVEYALDDALRRCFELTAQD